MILSGKKLSYERKIRNMTQDELCQKLGNIKKQNISMWENGSKPIPLKYYPGLIDIFGESIVDGLESVPNRLKNSFLKAFRDYALEHEHDLGYRDLYDNEVFANVIKTVSNLVIETECKDNKYRLVFSSEKNDSVPIEISQEIWNKLSDKEKYKVIGYIEALADTKCNETKGE